MVFKEHAVRRRWDVKLIVAVGEGRCHAKSAARCDESNQGVPIWEGSPVTSYRRFALREGPTGASGRSSEAKA